jgi:hypothetical protein
VVFFWAFPPPPPPSRVDVRALLRRAGIVAG